MVRTRRPRAPSAQAISVHDARWRVSRVRRIRSALMRRIVILSISSPSEHGVDDHARRRTPLGKLGELVRHGFEHVAPDAAASLTKKAHGRIPGQIGASGQPAPFRVALQRDPNRDGESPREMRDRSVARDDEIEASHRRRRIDEGVSAGVKIDAERLDPQRARQVCKLLLACAFLQRNESVRPRFRASGANAASGMERARSASGSGLPCQTTPILKPSGADALQPCFA